MPGAALPDIGEGVALADRPRRHLRPERDHRYELDGDDSRSLATIGAFRVVAERDLRENLQQGPQKGPHADRIVRQPEGGNGVTPTENQSYWALSSVG